MFFELWILERSIDDEYILLDVVKNDVAYHMKLESGKPGYLVEKEIYETLQGTEGKLFPWTKNYLFFPGILKMYDNFQFIFRNALLEYDPHDLYAIVLETSTTLNTTNPLPPRTVLAIVEDIWKVLCVMHSKRIFHNKVKVSDSILSNISFFNFI